MFFRVSHSKHNIQIQKTMGISESKFTEALDEVDSKYKTELFSKNQQIIELRGQIKRLEDEKTILKKKHTDVSAKLHSQIMNNSDFEMLLKKLDQELRPDSTVEEFMTVHNLEWMDDAVEKEWLTKFSDFLKSKFDQHVSTLWLSVE